MVHVLSSQNYSQIFKFSIDDKFKSIYNPVRALALSANKSKLLVGTLGSEVYEVPIDLA